MLVIPAVWEAETSKFVVQDLPEKNVGENLPQQTSQMLCTHVTPATWEAQVGRSQCKADPGK
jgi:hypothetical protein